MVKLSWKLGICGLYLNTVNMLVQCLLPCLTVENFLIDRKLHINPSLSLFFEVRCVCVCAWRRAKTVCLCFLSVTHVFKEPPQYAPSERSDEHWLAEWNYQMLLKATHNVCFVYECVSVFVSKCQLACVPKGSCFPLFISYFISKSLWNSFSQVNTQGFLLLSYVSKGHPVSVYVPPSCVCICARSYAGDDALVDYTPSAICVRQTCPQRADYGINIVAGSCHTICLQTLCRYFCWLL